MEPGGGFVAGDDERADRRGAQGAGLLHAGGDLDRDRGDVPAAAPPRGRGGASSRRGAAGVAAPAGVVGGGKTRCPRGASSGAISMNAPEGSICKVASTKGTYVGTWEADEKGFFLDGLSEGTYIVEVNFNGQKITRRFLVI